MAEPAFTACTCDPDVSYGTPTEFTGPYSGQPTVDVNLGNTPLNFCMAAYWQVYGVAPPGGTSDPAITTQVNKLNTLPYWRRVDVVNTYLLAAGSGKAKAYNNHYPNEYQFTTAPCKNSSRDVGAVCMFFFTCPAGSPGWVNCGMDWANTHGYGMTGFNVLENDNNNPGSNGLMTSRSNVGFWYRELLDGRYAGLSFFLPNAYGPDITDGSIDNLATALGQIAGSGIASQVKVGLFDDTSGWGTASYGPPWSTAPNMGNTAAAAASIYNNKWKPYFSKIPSQYWYTVGGRPLIYFYNGSGSLAAANSAAVIQAAKALFAAPVASGGFGVNPYVVVDRFYFADPAMNLSGANADNEFIWDTLHSAAQPGLANNVSTFSANGITLAHAIVKWDPLGRNYPTQPPSASTHLAGAGDGLIKDDSYLVAALGNSAGANILTIGTWNDLGEGTGINRNYDYYVNGVWKAPNYFMNDIRASQGNGSCGVVLPTATFTPTPTATATPHGPLVADMKNNTANNITYWNNGGIVQFHDSSSTSSVATPPGWTASSGTGPGSGGTDYAACWSGTLAPAASNPYSFLGFEIIPGGSISASGSGGAWTTVAPYATNNGFSFDYKAGAAGVTYQVQLTTQEVTDYDYYQFKWTAPDTNWHTISVYFPGTAAANVLKQVGFGAVKAFNPAHVGAILFQVIPQSTAMAYSLCVDNVTFVAPVPVPPTTPTHGPLVQDLENSAANNVSYWNQAAVINYHDGYGTTSNHSPWSASAGTGPGFGGTGFAACWSGNLTPTSAASPYPYSFLAFELVPGGSINSTGVGGAWTDVSPYSANSGLEFEYMAGAAGTLYQVQLTTQEVGADYGYYQYTFAAQNPGAWNKVDVYFPGVPAPNVFTRPAGLPAVALNPAHVGAVIFQVVPSSSGVPYNLCVDNVTFGCPPPPTLTPTPTASPTRTVTVTPSATASPSASPTATVTRSPSPSATPSASFSPSAAASATASRTASATLSPSPSRSSTPSSTAAASTFTSTSTASSTPSLSPSATGSASPSATSSRTLTASSTPSVSVSPTRTLSATVSPTAPGTFTDTPTSSPSRTGTLSSTISLTSTQTPMASPTQTPTRSATASVTAVATFTSTSTASSSASPSTTATLTSSVTTSRTASLTSSVSPIASPTALGTFTDTPSVTLSGTPSASATVTVPATATSTSTRTPISSATFTATATPSASASASATQTVTAGATQTSTRTATSVATQSSTSTTTPSRTATSTSTSSPTQVLTLAVTATFTVTPSDTAVPPVPTVDGSGPLTIRQGCAVPNPQHGSRLNFSVDLGSRADQVEVRLYTHAMVLVGIYRCQGSFGPNWSPLNFDLGEALPSGLYFARLTPQRGYTLGLKSEKVFKVMIIQ